MQPPRSCDQSCDRAHFAWRVVLSKYRTMRAFSVWPLSVPPLPV